MNQPNLDADLKEEIKAIHEEHEGRYGNHFTVSIRKTPIIFLVNGLMELLDQYQQLEIELKLTKGREKAKEGGYFTLSHKVSLQVVKGSKLPRNL